MNKPLHEYPTGHFLHPDNQTPIDPGENLPPKEEQPCVTTQ